jgi:hypothetical protein
MRVDFDRVKHKIMHKPVETLTLGTGTDFIQSSKPFTKLKMFLVKSKVTPQPMFVIETAYPN